MRGSAGGGDEGRGVRGTGRRKVRARLRHSGQHFREMPRRQEAEGVQKFLLRVRRVGSSGLKNNFVKILE